MNKWQRAKIKKEKLRKKEQIQKGNEIIDRILNLVEKQFKIKIDKNFIKTIYKKLFSNN